MENSIAITILYAAMAAFTSEILLHYFPKAKPVCNAKDIFLLILFAITEPYTIRSEGHLWHFSLYALCCVLTYEIIRRFFHLESHAERV